MNERPPSLIRTAVFISLLTFVLVFAPKLWEEMYPDTEIELRFDEVLDQAEKGNIYAITLESGESINKAISGRFKNPVNTKIQFKSTLLVPLVENTLVKIRDKNPGVRIEIAESSSMFFLWLLLIAITCLPLFFLFRAMRQSANTGLRFGRSKAKLSQGRDKKTFADVAGVEEAQEELREVIDFLKNPQKFQKLGGRIPKGVMLIGPPGCGKTLLAQAVAGEAGVPFFSISGSEFVEMFVGVGASRVRDLFNQGKSNAPCIIFIDELDAVGHRRGISFGHEEREQTLNQLLTEMDGFESRHGVIVMAASNQPNTLDPALMRPGRFDRQVVVDRPDIRGRLEILKVHTRRVVLDKNVNLSDIARGTVGFTGADLANLVNEAAIRAGCDDSKTVEMKHFETAKDKTTMGVERKSIQISDEEKRIAAIHESGHTVVAMNLPFADPVHKVTIIPRGMSLGSTHQLPTDDKHNFTKQYLESKIAILMAGRVAEEIFASQATTGAGSDFEVATELAHRMVCEWGMSPLGPRKLGTQTENPFLRGRPEGTQNYSEATSRKIDEAINELISSSVKTAREILRNNSGLVEKMVAGLIEKETLNADDIETLRKS